MTTDQQSSLRSRDILTICLSSVLIAVMFFAATVKGCEYVEQTNRAALDKGYMRLGGAWVMPVGEKP